MPDHFRGDDKHPMVASIIWYVSIVNCFLHNYPTTMISNMWWQASYGSYPLSIVVTGILWSILVVHCLLHNHPIVNPIGTNAQSVASSTFILIS
jgi:hypothetical protein